MSTFKAHKVVSSLPSPLEKDTVYYVRTGEGFDHYVTDNTGSIAHKVNGSGPRVETYSVTTNSSGEASITFSPAFTSPIVSVTPQRVAGDDRQVSAEFYGLSGSGVSVKTTREGTNQSLLGLLVLSPTSRVSTLCHVVVIEGAGS